MSNGKDQEQERVTIRRLPTGIPGLDEILGGGLPEYSFNIVAGALSINSCSPMLAASDQRSTSRS